MIPAEAVEAAVPWITNFLERRSLSLRGKEAEVLAGYVLTAAAPHMLAEVTSLVSSLTDPDDCSFDHHGGCQAHGYLDLKIGEMCPQLEAKAWAHNHRPAE